MFMKHETFMHSGAKLRYPTKEDREQYEGLVIKSRNELLDSLQGYVKEDELESAPYIRVIAEPSKKQKSEKHDKRKEIIAPKSLIKTPMKRSQPNTP